MCLMCCLRICCLVVLGLSKIGVCFSQLSLLLRDGLGIRCALVSTVLHQLFVILLCIFFLQFGLVHFSLQVVHHHVDHAQDAPRFLLFVSAKLRGRRRSLDAVGLDLNETNAGACNSLWGWRSPNVSAVCRIHPLFFSQLALRRSLVLLRVVELLQAVLRESQQVHSRLILRCRRHILLVFFLALLRRFGHCFVQVLDALLQSGNGFLEVLDAVIKSADLLFDLILFVRQLLQLVFSLVEFLVAILLLLVVILLLLVQSVLHLIDHGQHFVKTHFLALQSQSNQVQLGAAALRSRMDSVQRRPCHLLS
mmetsp:Transcript_81935/g.219198  ORF Transcript_81935/g.219198 Transcript_81935/m.219198 type:complete len:308 (-) Transcript_81935:1067-1990(-)